MRWQICLVVLCCLALSACGGADSGISQATSQAVTHSYNGTASVGDFLTLTVDPTAQTIAYTNHTNGDTGTVPYTVNSDGSYAIADPNGNLIAAYEVPGYALV